MSHWLVVPIVLPLLAGAAVLLFGNRGLALQRTLAVGATLLLLPVSLLLFSQAATGQVEAYLLGDWPAPFGIVLVLDRLSAMMLVLTAVLAVFALLHAVQGTDSEGSHFHALFQFQLLGLNGAFLTGDLFNLFVFFEILLIASYGLLLHGGGAARSRAGLHYVVINLTGSLLFLFAAALIYAGAGTLNLADLAHQVAAADAEQLPLLQSAALLLLVVFGLKAAILPLHFWLPGAYAAAPAAVAALFAIMTKVGVYAVIRVHTLMFAGEPSALVALAGPWLLPAAIATLAVGALGALASRELRSLVAYLILMSVGTLLAGVGLFNVAGLRGALYYLPHTTLVTAGLFLLADVVGRERGKAGTGLITGPALIRPVRLGLLFLIAGLAVVGIPPLSGFIGKVFILQAAAEAGREVLLWSALLVTGLVALVALSRAGSLLFWKSDRPADGAGGVSMPLFPAVALLAASPLLVIFAGPVADYAEATARQITEPTAYIESVVGADAPPTHRPRGSEFR